MPVCAPNDTASSDSGDVIGHADLQGRILTITLPFLSHPLVEYSHRDLLSL